MMLSFEIFRVIQLYDVTLLNRNVCADFIAVQLIIIYQIRSDQISGPSRVRLHVTGEHFVCMTKQYR